MQLPCTQCKQFYGLPDRSRYGHSFRGFGQYADLISAGMQMFNKGAGGSGSGGSSPPISVSTDVTTTTVVSPQISPQFIQQSNPVGSPVNAGATMGTPITGAMPGFDAASGYLPTGLPAIPIPQMQQAGMNPLLIFVAGGLILGAYLMKGKRKGKARRK